MTEIWWYLSRSSGIVATVLIAADGRIALVRVQYPVIEELKTIDLNQMNPVQAFDALRRMIEEVERG